MARSRIQHRSPRAIEGEAFRRPKQSFDEHYGNVYVQNGFDLDPTSGRDADLSGGTVTAHGRMLERRSSRSLTFAANKDTYLSIDLEMGTLRVRAVDNGDPAPDFGWTEAPLWMVQTDGTDIIDGLDLRKKYPFDWDMIDPDTVPPLGGFDPADIEIDDNTSGALRVHEGSNDYIRANTTNGLEELLLGVKDYPSLLSLGAGVAALGNGLVSSAPEDGALFGTFASGSDVDGGSLFIGPGLPTGDGYGGGVYILSGIEGSAGGPTAAQVQGFLATIDTLDGFTLYSSDGFTPVGTIDRDGFAGLQYLTLYAGLGGNALVAFGDAYLNGGNFVVDDSRGIDTSSAGTLVIGEANATAIVLGTSGFARMAIDANGEVLVFDDLWASWLALSKHFSDPTPATGRYDLYVKDIGATDELFYQRPDGSTEQITPAGSGFDPEDIEIADNTSGALLVYEGATDYIRIDTTTGLERIFLGVPTTFLDYADFEEHLSLNELGSAPSATSDTIKVYAKDDSGTTQLFAKASDGTEYQLTPVADPTVSDYDDQIDAETTLSQGLYACFDKKSITAEAAGVWTSYWGANGQPGPVASEQTSAVAVTGAANNGSGLIRITVASHPYSTGHTVVIDGVVGTTEANATWTLTVIDATHFDLQGSTFVHAYTSGGAVKRTQSYDNTAGGMFWPDQDPKVKTLRVFGATCTQDCVLVLYDRLVATEGVSFGSGGGGKITSLALPRYTDGEGVEAWAEITTIGVGTTPQITLASYTDQDGNTGQSGAALTLAATPQVRSMYQLPLAAGDTGVRAVESLTINTASTSGVLSIVLLRKIAVLGLSGNYYDELTAVAARVYDGATLALMLLASSTTGGNINGLVRGGYK